MRGLFVTGTDTGVGKTEVAVALLAGHRARGVDVAGMKPAESGAPHGPSDAERLGAAAGGTDDPALVCPYRFAAPLAPAVAARLEGRQVSFERVLACAAELGRRHAALLVEGAGGILVPLTERHSYADLARALGLPALVVARAGLGTVNHTALTCEALRVRGVEVAGVVLNHPTLASDHSEPFNAAEIERLAGARILASLPFVEGAPARELALREALAKVQF